MTDLLKDGYKLWQASWSGVYLEGLYVAKSADDVKQIRVNYYNTDEMGNDQLDITEKELKLDEPAYVEGDKTIMLIDLYNDVVSEGGLGDQIVWFEE